MDLRQLRYFIAVVETGSFTTAATVLHISQPPLSVAIAKLEAEVGVKLLIRTTRGTEPTAAGRYLLDAASRVQSDIDDITATLRHFGEGTAGTLTLAAVPALMWHRIPRVLRDFSRTTPEVEVRLVDPPPWQAIDMLQSRKADIAAVMVADPENFKKRHSGFDIRDWGPVPLVAVLPPDSGGGGKLMELTEFGGQLLVLPHRTAAVPSLPEAVESTLEKFGVTPRSVRTVETIQTCLPVIEAGIAWAILPDPDLASLSRFNVTVRPLAPEPKPLGSLILTRRSDRTNPAVQRFIEQAVQLTAQYPTMPARTTPSRR